MNYIRDDAPFLATTLGIRLVELTDERAVAEMPFSEAVRQPAGVFHTGAIVSLADTAATWGALKLLDPDGTDSSGVFPMAVQISANLIGNASGGVLRAVARPVHRGRSMLVMQTEVRSEAGKLLATVTTTHLPVVPRPPSA